MSRTHHDGGKGGKWQVAGGKQKGSDLSTVIPTGGRNLLITPHLDSSSKTRRDDRSLE